MKYLAIVSVHGPYGFLYDLALSPGNGCGAANLCIAAVAMVIVVSVKYNFINSLYI